MVGCKIFDLVFGCVFIEVDVWFLFDIDVIIVKVECLIGLYEDVGVKCDCILIKIVFIWVGICVVE